MDYVSEKEYEDLELEIIKNSYDYSFESYYTDTGYIENVSTYSWFEYLYD